MGQNRTLIPSQTGQASLSLPKRLLPPGGMLGPTHSRRYGGEIYLNGTLARCKDHVKRFSQEAFPLPNSPLCAGLPIR